MLSQNTIKYGVLAGVVGIVLGIIIYLLGPEFISASMWNGMIIGLVSLVVTIVVLIIFGTKIRKDEGGFISFKSMFINLFVMLVIMLAISNAFNILLFQVIDTEFMVIAKEAALENFSSFGDNMSEEQFEQMMVRTEEGFTQSIGKSIKQFGWQVLGWGIFSLILAAILKKKQEDFV